jgi:hypothetical protein
MTADEFLAEYTRLGHALQSGVAMELERGNQAATPKHLRTGLSCVMADLGSLTRLLVAKGLITDDDYYAAILEGLRSEVTVYEMRLSEQMGARIALA